MRSTTAQIDFEPTNGVGFTPDLQSYDNIILAFSGGKDSLAALLWLFELGARPDQIELWHHAIDGQDGQQFMDWPCTHAYCEAVAGAFDLPLYYSWKVGGFKRELLRQNQRTAPTSFEDQNQVVITKGGTRGSKSTRRKFPQLSSNLNTRWCSAYLKIDVCKTALRNQERFKDSRTLVLTGERGQESAARAKYEQFEPHAADLRDGKRYTRHVDHWRPLLEWYEVDVWAIIEKYSVRPHPAYYLGWGRVSCALCIFGSKDQWATARRVLPRQFEAVADLESEFTMTIREGATIRQLADTGNAYDSVTPERVAAARSSDYSQQVIMDNWQLPAGAFGDSAGPT